jgi:hypothetical protein
VVDPRHDADHLVARTDRKGRSRDLTLSRRFSITMRSRGQEGSIPDFTHHEIEIRLGGTD